MQGLEEIKKYLTLLINILTNKSIAKEVTNRERYLEMVKNNGADLRHIRFENQDRDICLEAVKQYGMALEFALIQDREICLEAIKQNSCAFRYAMIQDREIYLEAVKSNSRNLKYVREQDREICLKAVEKDRFGFEYVNEKFIDDVKEYLKTVDINRIDPNLKFIVNNDKKLFMDLLKSKIIKRFGPEEICCSSFMGYNMYYWGIRYIKQDYELCKLLMSLNDSDTVKYIDYKNRKLCLQITREFMSTIKYVNKQYIEVLIMKDNYKKYVLPKFKIG